MKILDLDRSPWFIKDEEYNRVVGDKHIRSQKTTTHPTLKFIEYLFHIKRIYALHKLVKNKDLRAADLYVQILNELKLDFSNTKIDCTDNFDLKVLGYMFWGDKKWDVKFKVKKASLKNFWEKTKLLFSSKARLTHLKKEFERVEFESVKIDPEFYRRVVKEPTHWFKNYRQKFKSFTEKQNKDIIW